MVDGALSVRTPAEELWLWRRSLGMSQAEAGEHFGMSEDAYWRAEAGESNGLSHAKPEPTVGHLCALARRRHGLTIHATAKMLGMSHVTLRKREHLGCPELARAWRRLGYRFPK